MEFISLFGFFSPLSLLFPTMICSHPTLWRPEYGSYMIEGTPGQPYGGTMSEFNTVEDNMDKRRKEASSVLNKDETLCTITSFPRYHGADNMECTMQQQLLIICVDQQWCIHCSGCSVYSVICITGTVTENTKSSVKC